jgi:radical SAM protein with 4Fe4S-binding SPASM domain
MLEVVLRDDNVPLYVGKEAPNFGGQPKRMTDNACGAGVNSFCITPEGNVQPCTAFPCSFGNLKSEKFKDIFETGEDLKWWKNLTLNEYVECGKHDYCGYCNLCAGNNYLENGTPLKAGELNCRIAQTRCELAAKMQNGYDPLQGKTLQERLSELQPEIRPLHQVFATSCGSRRGKRINEVSETTSETV